MNKLFKGLAAFAAASTLCVCPINATEDNKKVTAVTTSDDPYSFKKCFGENTMVKVTTVGGGLLLASNLALGAKVLELF